MTEALHTAQAELEALWEAAQQGRKAWVSVNRAALEHLLMDHGKLVKIAKRYIKLEEKENVAA